MTGRVLGTVFLLGVVYIVAISLPDVTRYLRIRAM